MPKDTQKNALVDREPVNDESGQHKEGTNACKIKIDQDIKKQRLASFITSTEYHQTHVKVGLAPQFGEIHCAICQILLIAFSKLS